MRLFRKTFMIFLERKIRNSAMTAILVLELATLVHSQQPPTRLMMPVPASAKFNEGRLLIDTNLSIDLCSTSGIRAHNGLDRAMRRLEGRTGFTFNRNVHHPSAKLVVCSQGPGQDV